jgi:hypothetical protein
MFNSPQADRDRLRKFMQDERRDVRKQMLHNAAEAVWQACGGVGVERKSDEEIERLLAKMRNLVSQRDN